MLDIEQFVVEKIDHERAKAAAYAAVAKWSQNETYPWSTQEVKRGYEMDSEGYTHKEIAEYLHLREENVPKFLRMVEDKIELYEA